MTTKVSIDFDKLSALVALSHRNNKQDVALELCLDWAGQANDRLVDLEKMVSAYREVLCVIRDTAEKHTADLADSVLKFNEDWSAK